MINYFVFKRYNFQRLQVPVQPGSMDNEAGIFSITFDMSGSRMITTDVDKTIKLYKEDESAVSELILLSSVQLVHQSNFFALFSVRANTSSSLAPGDCEKKEVLITIHQNFCIQILIPSIMCTNYLE